jgi:hypothetical protein
MTRQWVFAVFAGLGVMALLGMDYAGKPVRFPSPQAKFAISFEKPLSQIHTDPDAPLGGPRSQSIRYQIAFYQAGITAPMASSEFYDIYESSPTPVLDLVKKIVWSPEEDFAILPRENWPPGSNKGRKLVSLNQSMVWEYLTLKLDDASLAWIDRFRLAGNLQEGCKLSVVQFDGKTGKTSPVMEGGTGSGYQVVGTQGKKIVMKKILSTCATDQDSKDFIPECVTLDLAFMRREITSCSAP